MMSMASWSDRDFKTPCRNDAAVYRCCEDASGGERPAAKGDCDPGAGGEQERGEDAAPQGQQENGRRREDCQLPRLVERARERYRRADDRADRRRPGAVEERPCAPVAAQPVEVFAAEQDERERGENATAAASRPPPMPAAP